MVRSVKFVLGVGVGGLLAISIGLVGTLETLGTVRTALEITRTLQDQRTVSVGARLTGFFAEVERDVFVLAELLGTSSDGLEEVRVAHIFTAFLRHKPHVTDVTLVRRDGSNLMAWQEDGEAPQWVRGGVLDQDSVAKAVDGREGFEDVHLEPEEQRPVITYTKHLVDGAGLPIGDIFLNLDVATLSRQIAVTENDQSGYRFVFDGAGRILAHPALADPDPHEMWDHLPHVDDLDDPVAQGAYRGLQEFGPEIREITADGEDWLLSIAALDDSGHRAWFAADVVPRREILGHAFDRARTLALIGGAILLLAVVLAVRVGRAIVGPVSRLAAAAQAVQSLDLAPPSQTFSRFSELGTAERAFVGMQAGLEVFARYVPKSLVQRLIHLEQRGEGIVPEERVVTILFTDIAGFTAISAGMPPTALAPMLNGYFEAVVLPIINSDGTVDKFIGDALMAFWNAPIHQDDHADRAVTAALKIRAVVASLNAARLAAGQAPLITRIGIHTGPVLVGNIGARERMNYTIVGDAVNVAARLEALGKDMGETLCISSDTHDATNTARRWREIGNVTLRGRRTETMVYTIDES